MGYNTVAVILNDGIDLAARDPEFGRRVNDAVNGWHRRNRDRFACEASAVARLDGGGTGSHSGVLRVVSQAHADTEQVVIVSRNSGQKIEDAMDLGWYALDVMKACLERHGYTVTKRRKPKDGTPAQAVAL